MVHTIALVAWVRLWRFQADQAVAETAIVMGMMMIEGMMAVGMSIPPSEALNAQGRQQSEDVADEGDDDRRLIHGRLQRARVGWKPS
jgi:hypothetical protein